MVKNPPANAGDTRGVGSIPRSGRSLEKWQFTPVFLAGKSYGQRSLVGYGPWGCKESDTTDWLSTYTCTCEHQRIPFTEVSLMSFLSWCSHLPTVYHRLTPFHHWSVLSILDSQINGLYILLYLAFYDSSLSQRDLSTVLHLALVDFKNTIEYSIV